jgi:hypothetical protein
MNDFEILHKYSPNDIIVKMTVKTLMNLLVVRWKHNRPADTTRCEEMKDYYMKTNSIINMPFHLHYNHRFDEYECIDGFHRYTSLNMVENKELVNDKTIISYIYYNKTDGELVDIFKDINKSVSVPKLYTEEEYDQTDKRIIENVLNEWKSKYESHFSASKNPNSPQINRETFAELLTHVFTTYKIRSDKKLMELIVETNEWIKSHVHGERKYVDLKKKPTPQQLEKCAKTGCYLFLYKDSTVKEIIIPRVKSKYN